MLKKIWIFQPDEIVPLGRYENTLKTLDIPYELVKLWENPPLPDPDPSAEALIILGGRANALDTDNHPWLQRLYQQLSEWVKAGLPVLGICLGHQILAHALGGKISLQDKQGAEDGPCRISLTTAALTDPIFTSLSSFGCPNNQKQVGESTTPQSNERTLELKVYQSHHDIVSALPTGATLLASSAKCKNQAFRYKNVWTVQFHPETTAAIMRRWAEGEGNDGQSMYDSCVLVEEEVGKIGLQILENFLAFAAVVR